MNRHRKFPLTVVQDVLSKAGLVDYSRDSEPQLNERYFGPLAHYDADSLPQNKTAVITSAERLATAMMVPQHLDPEQGEVQRWQSRLESDMRILQWAHRSHENPTMLGYGREAVPPQENLGNVGDMTSRIAREVTARSQRRG